MQNIYVKFDDEDNLENSDGGMQKVNSDMHAGDKIHTQKKRRRAQERLIRMLCSLCIESYWNAD